MKKARLTKQKVSEKKKKVNNAFSFKKLIITLLIMLIVLVAFYFLTDFILKKRKSNDETDQTEETVNVRTSHDIDYTDAEKIVADTYYLLYDKSDDENNETYDMLINSLKYSNYPIDFYYIDLSKDENKKILTDKSSLEDLKDIKVKDTTLLYVENKKIKDKYEGSEEVLNHLLSFFQTAETTDENNDQENSNKTEDSNKESSNEK